MEYEKKYNDLIARINEVKEKPRLCMKDKHHYNGYVETGIRDALDYIVSPESEDERVRTRLIALVEAFGQGKYKDEMLAYLEKQKEQKPAEWSELDKEMLQSILDEYKSMMQEKRNWLSQLPERFTFEPHWKPSEEQVSILGKVFAGCELNTSERDSMVDLFYHLKDMI